jgi:lysophospholipase L1-like esterase
MKKEKSVPGNYNLSRRKFIRNAGIGTASLGALPAMLSACGSAGTSPGESAKMKEALEAFFAQDDVVLFQGDSITDAGREKKDELPNNARSFGSGYAYIIASRLLSDLADRNLIVYNRGFSGNKVFQLDERWQKDCLDLKPDVLSILIGVNDYWHMRNGRYDGTPEIYERDYRNLLARTKSELPEIKLVICEPFILTGTSAVDESWLEPFSHYQKIAAKLAGEFGAVWVPFQSAFNHATELAPAPYWTRDGVHPSMPGCELMAEAWLKAVSS